ncbi:MAG: M50 family metallopeptidase, partial [Acidimicrobiales bacterium]
MHDTVRLGRLRGVPIGVNWSLLAIIVFLGFGLAGNRLPVDVPGRTGLAYAVAGGLTAVALIVAVLVHELGHAFVARQAGMKVDGITLSWMGGVTRIEGDAPTPGRELAIAVVGPIISLALGGACWLARIVTHAAGHHQLLAAALGWLATINILLAAFNLLPAAPLDGGRVLHAAIWKATKDRWRAARLASRAGIGLGVLVVAAGTVMTVQRRNNIDGLIVAVMGWWLITAARSEEQVAGVHRA